MGRAYKQWQRMQKSRKSSPLSKQSREFGWDLRNENNDLWERAHDLGVWGSTYGMGLGEKSLRKDARSKAGLWQQASMLMGMGDISNEKDLKKLLDTYDKSGIQNFDSKNDLMDFKKAYEKESFEKMYKERAGSDFQELFSAFAEQAGIATPEGGWKMPETWGQTPGAPSAPGQAPAGGAAGGAAGGQRPPWAPEGADPWGRRGEGADQPAIGWGPAWGGAGSYGGGGGGWSSIPYAGQPSQTSGWASQYYTPQVGAAAGHGMWGSGTGAQTGSWNYAPQGAW